MKIVHISDNHLGKAQFYLAEREEDLYGAFNQAIELALMEKPDLIIHTGDLFDSYRPHPRAFVKAFEGFLKVLERDIPIAIIEGNHELGADTIRRRITSPIVNLKRLFERLGYENFFRLGPGIERIGDLVIGGIPYTSRGAHIVETIESLDRKRKQICNCPSILMIHQGVKGMIKAFYPEIEISDIARSSFDYVAMGHYHNRVVYRKGNRVFAYSGSTEVIEMREVPISVREGKSILSIDLDRGSVEVRPLALRTRPFVYINERISNTRELYSLIETISQFISSLEDRPVIVGKVRVNEVKVGLVKLEFKRALQDKALFVKIDEVRQDEVERPAEQIPTGIGLEDVVHSAIGSMRLDDDVKRLALTVFDLWYREGRRGDPFIQKLISMAEGD